jgi:undecaprenyl-diphosphatase
MDVDTEIIMLGAIQGLTEWLPISSTGHLKLIEIIFGLSLPLLFDVILHVGTLIVTIFFFRDEIRRILAALIKFDFKSKEGRLVLRIIVGSVPTAIIGFILLKLLEDVFQRIFVVSIAFIISGLLIGLSKMGREVKDCVDYKSAIIIGIAQGFSIIPGLSRSGLTISVALILGIKREEAFKFSFLLSIPAVLGALSVTIYYQAASLLAAGIDLVSLIIGSLVAMLLGYISLRVLHRFLHKFHIFTVYPLILGSSLIICDFLL